MEPTMEKIVAMFAESGKTLDQLGQEMGYEPETARKAAWQFLKKTSDPRLSMLKRFAKAMEIPLEELVTENKTSRSK